MIKTISSIILEDNSEKRSFVFFIFLRKIFLVFTIKFTKSIFNFKFLVFPFLYQERATLISLLRLDVEYRWPTNTCKDAQHCSLLEKYTSKLGN